MRTFSLQSGSNGNSIYVEVGDKRLLFDAGISGKQAELRMREHGRDIRDCDAVILSHDHSDHTRCAGIFQRKFGLPICVTQSTFRRIQPYAGKVHDLRYFSPGDTIVFDDVRVRSIPTPHDATESVCFVVEHDGKRLGIFTDLGHPFRALREAIHEVDAMYLESNYDPEMLESGPYPWHLKQRIAGAKGHISNSESADLVRDCGGRQLKWVAAAHLSGENNCPDLAIETHRKQVGTSFPVHLAYRDGVSDVLEV